MHNVAFIMQEKYFRCLKQCIMDCQDLAMVFFEVSVCFVFLSSVFWFSLLHPVERVIKMAKTSLYVLSPFNSLCLCFI